MLHEFSHLHLDKLKLKFAERLQKKMKNNIFTLLIVALGFTICACNQASVDTIASNTVMSSQVYQVYSVEASRSNSQIVATFRVGGATGTTLELTAPGKIFYNTAELAKSDPSNLIGTNYRMKGTDYRLSSKSYQTKHEFSFTDNDGKTYVNSISLAPIEIVSTAPFSLQTVQLTTIPLSRAVGTDEKLTISLDTIIDDEIPTADNSVYFNQTRSAIIVTPKYWQTKSLKAKAELQIEVAKTDSISQGTALGGSISAKYSAAPIFVSVSNSKSAATNANVRTANANIKSANANMTTKPIAANTTAKTEIVAPKIETNVNANK